MTENPTDKIVKSKEGFALFVSNIDIETEEEDLYDLFEDYCPISKIILNLDRESGLIKGYAIVLLKKKEMAINAVKELNGIEFRNKNIKVDFAFKPPEKEKITISGKKRIREGEGEEQKKKITKHK